MVSRGGVRGALGVVVAVVVLLLVSLCTDAFITLPHHRLPVRQVSRLHNNDGDSGSLLE